MNSSFLLSLVTFGYFFAALAYLLFVVFKKDVLGLAGTVLTIVVSLTGLLTTLVLSNLLPFRP